MLDFTSSLFLGRSHPVPAGRPVDLTSGRPAALAELPAATAVAAALARTAGFAAGVVHRTALHALTDVVGLSAGKSGQVLLDDALYPIAEAAVFAATAGKSLRVSRYRHQDARSVARAVHGARGPVLVVSDGWCTGCQRPAPLVELAAIAAGSGGVLIVDDTQAFGILGERPRSAHPFGCGGGGTLRWLGGSADEVLQVNSLAKAYGAPLAVTLGPERRIAQLATAPMRWHASPPTTADLAAAVAAVSDVAGAAGRRQWLYRLVSRLRSGLRRLGLAVVGHAFPAVSISGAAGGLNRLQQLLRADGVRALLVQPRCRPRPSLTLLVTADHGPGDIDRVLAILARAGDVRRAG